MPTKFKLTEEDMGKTEIYNSDKTDYVCNYLVEFFTSKKNALENHIKLVECFEHGMEEFTISKDVKFGMHGFCFKNTFGDWENTLLVHWNAKLKCGKDFPIGFYFVFRFKDLVKITDQLTKLDNLKLVSGYEFDEKNKIDIITGYRQNNLTKV